jgi:hypothetical protein
MTLYFATDNALAVLTTEGDRGRSDLYLTGRNARFVAVDPLQPRFVYGGFGAVLCRSEDAGQTWRQTGEGIGKIQSVAVSRSERVNGRGIIYVGTEPSAVFRSEDGETWRECMGLTELRSAIEWSFPPRSETHHVRWIEPDPHIEGRLFIAIEAGALIRSPDAGITWQDRTPGGPRETHISCQSITPSPVGYIRQPVTVILRAVTVVIRGNVSRRT